MEPWELDYRPARFRDAGFYVDSDECGPFGQRVAIHEFPNRDDPVVQRLGKNKHEFSFDAYCLGKDYINDIKKLMDACEDESPGELVLPILGSRVCVCTGMKIRTKSSTRRIAYASLTFIQVDSFIPELEESIDSTVNLLSNRKTALEKLSEYFSDAYNLVNKPYAYALNAQETLNNFLSQVSSNRSIVGSASGFMRILRSSATQVAFLVFDAADLISSISSLLSFGTSEDDDSFPATSDNARNQFTEVRKFFSFEPERVIDDTDPSIIMAQSIQAASLISLTGLLPLIEYDSLDEAEVFKSIVLTKIDYLSSVIVDDRIYESLYELRKSIMIDMEQRSFTLSRLSNIILNESTPALVLSFQLYGNLDQEEDLIKRNSALHPGFLPGGQELEVLLNVV